MYETYNLIMLQLNAQATFIESIKFCNKKNIKNISKKRKRIVNSMRLNSMKLNQYKRIEEIEHSENLMEFNLTNYLCQKEKLEMSSKGKPFIFF